MEESRATDSKQAELDLSVYSDLQLDTLVRRIEKELVRRTEERKRDALKQVRAIAEGLGMTVEELLKVEKRPSAKLPEKQKMKVLRHPDHPEMGYFGGRKPAWLTELEKQGRRAIAYTLDNDPFR